MYNLNYRLEKRSLLELLIIPGYLLIEAFTFGDESDAFKKKLQDIKSRSSDNELLKHDIKCIAKSFQNTLSGLQKKINH